MRAHLGHGGILSPAAAGMRLHAVPAVPADACSNPPHNRCTGCRRDARRRIKGDASLRCHRCGRAGRQRNARAQQAAAEGWKRGRRGCAGILRTRFSRGSRITLCCKERGVGARPRCPALAGRRSRRHPEDSNAATGTMTVHRAPPRHRTLRAGAVGMWTLAQCEAPRGGLPSRATRPHAACANRVPLYAPRSEGQPAKLGHCGRYARWNASTMRSTGTFTYVCEPWRTASGGIGGASRGGRSPVRARLACPRTGTGTPPGTAARCRR